MRLRMHLGLCIGHTPAAGNFKTMNAEFWLGHQGIACPS
jgi:hypothetical protein